jgi:hypothetical protein
MKLLLRNVTKDIYPAIMLLNWRCSRWQTQWESVRIITIFGIQSNWPTSLNFMALNSDSKLMIRRTFWFKLVILHTNFIRFACVCVVQNISWCQSKLFLIVLWKTIFCRWPTSWYISINFYRWPQLRIVCNPWTTIYRNATHSTVNDISCEICGHLF